MFSLYVNFYNWALLFNIFFTSIVNSLFLSLIFFALVLYTFSNTKWIQSIFNVFKVIFLVFLIIFGFILFFKIYFILYYDFVVTYASQKIVVSNASKTKLISVYSHLTILGDILTLLCTIVSIICWVVLGERYLLKTNLNLVYFTTFLLFTFNMVQTQNIFIMVLFFELIFLPSLYFVYVSGYAKRVDESVKYLLLWTFFGSLLVLCGLLYLYTTYKTGNIYKLMQLSFSDTEVLLLFITFTLGFGVKLPLWPFHYWLTKVHVEAPAGFSIFLSGFLVKTALYCLHIFYILFVTKVTQQLLLGLVLFGVVDASCRMWAVVDIKRLIAFATIQEMNLIFLFLISTPNLSLSLVNLFILVHGLLSAVLFFLIDQLQKRFQTRNIFSIGALATRLVILPVFVWLAILIFRGFPIFIKFFIEWEMLMLLNETYFIIGFFYFLFFTVFAVLGFSRIFLIALYGHPKLKTIFWVDMLKKDLIILTILVFILFILLFCVLYF